MELNDIIKEENIVYRRTPLMTDKILSYCPGCGHGTTHRIIMEVIEEMGIQSQTVGVAPVGCSVLAYDFMDIDWIQAPHGRAPAVATGLKRVMPDKFIFSYQGDGDLAAIGTGETIHACNRGENITIIFINNGIYGMTGGQMAPTTLPGMVSSTCPYGRDVKTMGNPIKMTELVAQLPGTYFVTRQAVHSPNAVRKAKKAIRKAFENQKLKQGLSFVEILSSCSTNWGLSPIDANKWIKDKLTEVFPVKTFRDKGEEK